MDYLSEVTPGRGVWLKRILAAGHRRGGLAALAGLTGLVMLAAGCGSPASSPAAQGQPHASGSRGGATGANGLVSPPPGSGGTSGPNSGGEPAGTGRRSGVVGGALFGSDSPLAQQEGKLGRKMAIVRVYRLIGQSFPDSQEKRFMSTGSTLLVSLDTLQGRGPTYASIAAGQHDASILGFLKKVNQAAVQYRLGAIYMCFEHEANTPAHHAGLGSPAEFVKAWDHVHQLAVSAHLDWNQGGRLHWVWILAHLAFRTNRPGRAGLLPSASDYWPGSNEVDIVAADGYNNGGKGHSCRVASKKSNFVEQGSQSQSPAKLFGPVLTFAKAHGDLPVFISEWGTISYASSAVQPGYIHQMQAYVTANHEIAAAMYWNGRPPHGPCDYSVVDHSASIAALAAMGHSPGLQGHVASAG